MRIALLISLLPWLGGSAKSQSSNALPHAAREVFRAFPEATKFRTIVRDVDQKARGTVEKGLPFKVHFNELGPHSLYVAFRRLKPVGLLYVRTEDSEWGLVEISWTLSLDLRVIGYRFLSARGVQPYRLQKSAFAKLLAGRSFGGLARLLNKKGALSVPPGSVPKGSEPIAQGVIRSGMKTLLVLGTVWDTELGKLQDLAMGIEVFPSGRSVRRQPVASPTAVPRLRLTDVRAVRVYGAARTELGIAVHTEFEDENRAVSVRWALTPGLRVLRIAFVTKSSRELRAAANELIGRVLEKPGSGRMAPVAVELARVLRSRYILPRIDAPPKPPTGGKR